MPPFISLCMIVKNEEKVLKRCLESIDGLIEEIIIVDTGSTDNTKKIASEFNTIIYDYDWIENFSAARNYAQSKATGKWILFLDADEYVDPQNFKETMIKLRELDLKSSLESYIATQINFGGNYGEVVNPCLTIRIYKNDPSIEFYRSIHEQLYKKNGELSVGFLNFYIYHSGYLKTTQKEKCKTDRNVNLLLSELKNSENAFDYFNMGNEFSIQGKTEEALDSYRKAYLLKEDTNRVWLPNAVERIIYCLLKLERYDDALVVVDDALLYWTNIADFKCMKGYIYILLKMYEEAEKELLDLILNKDKYRACHSVNYLEYFPYRYLGEIYEEIKEIKRAVRYYSYALNFNEKDTYIMEKIYKLLLMYANHKDVITFINKQNSFKAPVNRYLLIKVLLDIGEIELVKYYIDYWNLQCSVGLIVKYHLIKGEYDIAHDFLMQISIAEMLSEGWVDINDIAILALKLENEKIRSKLTKEIQTSYKWLNNLLNGYEVERKDFVEIKNLLQRCIQFKKFELFEIIINKLPSKSMYVDIGNLLYKNKFEKLALDFYQEAVLSQLDEQALVNIIESFIKEENLEDALHFGYMAIEQNKIDYRIFKMTIGILNKLKINDDKEKLIDIAVRYFPESEYINGMKDDLVLSIIE